MDRYDGLEIEVLRFLAEDILTASAEPSEDSGRDDSCGDDSCGDDSGSDNSGGNEITYTFVAGGGDSGDMYQGSDGNLYVLVDGEYMPYTQGGS